MFYETINKERLDRYLDSVKALDEALRKKHLIEARIGNKGIDYSKTKITHGNGKQTTEPEKFAIDLERINKEIDELKAFTIPEHKILVAQISRLKKHAWRKAITYRYIEGEKISDIVQREFYYEPDFEDEKNGKYKKRVERWLSDAIDELEKVSLKPFIKKERQLVFEGVNNESS